MRRAVLIAASRFDAEEEFPPLRFTLRDAERLREVLLDPGLCGFERVALIADQRASAARKALEREARASEPGDLLLFYYSGHGRLDRDGSLALAMPESDPECLGATSLISDELKRLFNISRASQKVMILDCCYSGAAGGAKGSLAASIESVAQQFTGSFLLSASRRSERAFELEKERAGALTEALVEGVSSGAASTSASDHITLTELAVYARKKVLASGAGQQPEYWDNGGIGGLAFAKKPARFDKLWAKRARAMVTRHVANRILDEDLADDMRDAINLRADARHEGRIRLIDRLLKKEISVNAFARGWSDQDRPPPPPPPPPPPLTPDTPAGRHEKPPLPQPDASPEPDLSTGSSAEFVKAMFFVIVILGGIVGIALSVADLLGY